eukprot:402052_1
MSTHKQKEQALVHGYIRKCQKYVRVDIPNDIIEMIAKFYVAIFEHLQLVKICTDKDNNLILKDNRYLATILKKYQWELCVQADIKPIMDGIHCFRVYNKH